MGGGKQLALQKGISDQDIFVLKGISFLCNMQHDFSSACTIVVSHCPSLDKGENLLPLTVLRSAAVPHSKSSVVKQDSELCLKPYLYGPSSFILLQLCFILKGTLPFYSKETLNTLLCHQFINTYAESIACLAERSPVKQVIQNTLTGKSTTFKNRTREFSSGRLLAARVTSKRGCYCQIQN